eukprot:7655149-Lingulodinium_polyedra.AAC.1
MASLRRRACFASRPTKPSMATDPPRAGCTAGGIGLRGVGIHRTEWIPACSTWWHNGRHALV